MVGMQLAPMHHRLGVRAVHMPLMKGLIFKVFEESLGDEFKDAERQAWDFLWAYMTVCMTQTLEEVGSTLTVVRDSWDSMMSKYSSEDIGKMVYEKLFQLVPNVASIFTKPKQEMAIKMGNMLEMLVSCASEPDNMKQQLIWLGLRHVNYNVKPRHLPLMGPVLMAVLSEAAAENWSSTVEKAWDTLWKLVMETMSESLAEGLEYGERSRRLIALVREKATATTVGHLLLTALSSSCPAMVHAFCHTHVEEKTEGDMADDHAETASSVGTGGSIHGGLAPSSHEPATPSLPDSHAKKMANAGTADGVPGSLKGAPRSGKNDTSLFLSPGDPKRAKSTESVMRKSADGGESPLDATTQAHLQVTPATKAGKKSNHRNEEQARALGNALWAFVIECRSDIAGVPC
jgi:hemoglobin-like flavoprotein